MAFLRARLILDLICDETSKKSIHSTTLCSLGHSWSFSICTAGACRGASNIISFVLLKKGGCVLVLFTPPVPIYIIAQLTVHALQHPGYTNALYKAQIFIKLSLSRTHN